MMKWTRYMLLMPVLMVQALSSCSLIDEPENTETGNVDVSLAFTVSSATGSSTRMADAVVQEQKQENERSYRGLGAVYMIPFAISSDHITSTDRPLRLLQDASLLESHDPQTGNYGGFYLYNVYTLFKITWGSGWKFLLLLIPIANIIIMIITEVKLAKAFGKSNGFAVGLVLLSTIFMLILAFGSSEYKGVPQKA